MALHIDENAFARGHEAFKKRMLENSRAGAPFTSFGHDFLLRDEISYKHAVYVAATEVLDVPRWPIWKRTPGKILAAVKKACSPKISRNLLEHRWNHGSYAALYRVNPDKEVQGLEEELCALFSGSTSPAQFGPRFDTFTAYLRAHRLRCPWPFPTYLAFLISPGTYFPVRPKRMDLLLKSYGITQKIAGSVTWDTYSVLLELAEVLRQKLIAYGPGTAIELQSYMWEVSFLIEHGLVPARLPPRHVDFDEELSRRIRAAHRRERIGLEGERHVLEEERRRLERAKRSDLARRASLVSANGGESGYDICSFEVTGSEIHIEVKTTASTLDEDQGFYLTERERQQATSDSCWTVYRVSSIDTSPRIEVLGNVVTDADSKWDLSPSGWLVRRV